MGKPKVGKSTFVYDLIRAIERGERFLGRPTVRTKAVVLTEESAATVREKIDRQDIREASFLLCDSLGKYAFRDVIGYAAEHARREGAGVLIVDTLAPWARLPEDGENDAGVVLAALEPLAAAASKGFAVVVIHHTNKAGTTIDDSVRGSTALSGAVEVVTLFGQKKGSRTRRVLTTRSRFEGQSEPIECDRPADSYVLTGTAASVKLEERMQRIIDAVQHGPERGLTEDALRKAAHMKTRDLKCALRELEGRGLVEVEGAGRAGDPKRYRPKPPGPHGANAT